jgi:hypothetical protein
LQRANTLINDCGWKGGDSGKRGKGRTLYMRKVTRENYKRKNSLTVIGLLMEGDSAQNTPSGMKVRLLPPDFG